MIIDIALRTKLPIVEDNFDNKPRIIVACIVNRRLVKGKTLVSGVYRELIQEEGEKDRLVPLSRDKKISEEFSIEEEAALESPLTIVGDTLREKYDNFILQAFANVLESKEILGLSASDWEEYVVEE